MKRLVLTLAICFGCIGILGAQNVWKSLEVPGAFLGADAQGNLYAQNYYGLQRSQNESLNWELVLELNFVSSNFIIGEKGRLFVIPWQNQTMLYSDDNGDTWEETSPLPYVPQTTAVTKMYSPSNDTILCIVDNNCFWTTDGGMTWGFEGLELDEESQVGDMIVNAEGDVYVSTWSYSDGDAGIFHSTLSDMQNWELVAAEGINIKDMAFDPEGNVVACGWSTEGSIGFQHTPGFYLFDGTSLAIGDGGIVYTPHFMGLQAVLSYSTDHGEHFTGIGEHIPLVDIAPGGDNARLFKGADNHLYFDGGGEYWKSIRDADRIIENFPLDNTHYADAIQICASDDQPQFPLTVNVENAESGPYYGCLNTQPNPAWFFVKMDEPGDIIININVQSDGFFDVDFCCWGPFSELPESSGELTQDKVVDCAYDTSPATCTIPSTAQTGEYFVLLVTNYANRPGDLTFTSGGGTGSLECPGANPREWYYEIQNENGSITYQYLYQAGDTIINDEPTHILVKINTLYDKDLHQDVTHEYVYERDGKLYWWNKTLEEFTVLYDFGAQEGDSWVIKVGTETLTMHVDAVEEIEYEGRTYRMLRVSDPEDLFSGNIVCGIGHLTSFFPERLMDNGDGIRVEGMRCYWSEGELVFKYGDEDCDAVYSEVHGVEEDGPSTGSRTLTVYPNPTNGVLFVQTLRATSLPAETYRITNLMGQTLLAGQITNENQQINVSSLPQGMYFITIAGETRKFVVR
ncbi:MAG: T9SS type A sorting domain-containing protein [Bacteroidales bacterium]|nr:T9SS type A sorting domain-containing protein [Bacteroidales bacterium]